MMAPLRVVQPDPPSEMGVHDGLAFALFAPAGQPRCGVVVLHGADSCKESHYAFARHCRAAGMAAVAFDMRGHGESPGRLDGRAVSDVLRIAGLLPRAPLVLRGSSMGGYLALVAGAEVGAAGVVALCPASAGGLQQGLDTGRFGFAADRPALAELLAEHDEVAAAEALGARLLLHHARGDEAVPVERSRMLHAVAVGSRYVEVPGGHHRTVQHDRELHADAVRWIGRRVVA